MILHRFNAALIINIAAIVMGASAENTLKISLYFGQVGKILIHEIKRITAKRIIAVTSTLTFSQKKEQSAKPSKTKLIIASISILSLFFNILF